MNFLLHRHFALRETGSEVVAFGAMLPDLVRLVDRRWRPRTGTGIDSPDRSPVARALQDGIAHHLEADIWFHRTQVFREGEKRTAAALRATGDGAPRIGLFAHVTWEMCLDGAWLRRTGDIEAALAALSADVQQLASESNTVLREATSTSASPEFVEGRLALLWSRLPELAAGYAVGDGLARRLDGVRRSLGLPQASDDLRAIWAESLEKCLQDAGDALTRLEAERGPPGRSDGRLTDMTAA